MAPEPACAEPVEASKGPSVASTVRHLPFEYRDPVVVARGTGERVACCVPQGQAARPGTAGGPRPGVALRHTGTRDDGIVCSLPASNRRKGRLPMERLASTPRRMQATRSPVPLHFCSKRRSETSWPWHIAKVRCDSLATDLLPPVENGSSMRFLSHPFRRRWSGSRLRVGCMRGGVEASRSIGTLPFRRSEAGKEHTIPS